MAAEQAPAQQGGAANVVADLSEAEEVEKEDGEGEEGQPGRTGNGWSKQKSGRGRQTKSAKRMAADSFTGAGRNAGLQPLEACRRETSAGGVSPRPPTFDHRSRTPAAATRRR